MKIGTANPQAQSRPAARTLEFNLRNAWLRELERAQLEGWADHRLAPSPGTPELPDPERPAGTAPGGVASGAAALERSGSECAAPVDAHPDPERVSGAPEADRAAWGHADRGASAASRSRCDAPEARARELVRANRLPAVDPLLTPCPMPDMGVAPDRAGVAGLRVAPAIDAVEKTPDAGPSAELAPPLRDRPWPARSVHMTVERSEARVWIRDNNLAQSATGGILSSLSGELALRGLRLRTLTLNGRVAFDADSASDAEQNRKAAAGSKSAGLGKTSRLHSFFLKR